MQPAVLCCPWLTALLRPQVLLAGLAGTPSVSLRGDSTNIMEAHGSHSGEERVCSLGLLSIAPPHGSVLLSVCLQKGSSTVCASAVSRRQDGGEGCPQFTAGHRGGVNAQLERTTA